jgi:homoaconitase/3-isopropylmalate dehydratase large subunit
MGLTFAEKVLSAQSGREVRAGEIVTVEPDIVLSHDNSAAIAKHFKSIGVTRVRYPERLVIVLDHCVPAADFKHATNHKQIREFVTDQGIAGFYDIHRGVCHQVLLEEGFAGPGRLVVGSDSHTTSYGAVGAFSAGIGRTEAACTWATGELWLRVPETLRLAVAGEWPWRVGAKDLALHVAGLLGADGADYMSVEWTGAAIAALSVDSRIVLCNMSAEIGAKNGYVPPDAKVAEWLESVGAHGCAPSRAQNNRGRPDFSPAAMSGTNFRYTPDKAGRSDFSPAACRGTEVPPPHVEDEAIAARSYREWHTARTPRLRERWRWTSLTCRRRSRGRTASTTSRRSTSSRARACTSACWAPAPTAATRT